MLKIKITDDEEIKNYVKSQLLENGGYCPCRIVHTPDTKCMCKEFREQKSPGFCHCELYEKVKVDN